MKGKIYLREAKVLPYNLFLQGPTWGLRRASKRLARLAGQGQVNAANIQEELSFYPQLMLRLHNRGLDLISLNEGAQLQDILKLFKTLIYSTKEGKEKEFLGFEISEDAPAKLYPQIDRMFRYINKLNGKKDKISRYLDLKLSPGLKILAFLACAPVHYALTIGSGALGCYLLTKYGVPSMWLGLEQETGFGIDFVLGGISGLFLGGIPSHVSENALDRNRTFAITGALWQSLRDFHQADAKSVSSQVKPLAKTLGKFERNLAVEDLAPLGFEKVKLLSKHLDKRVVVQAYVECSDTPAKILHFIAYNEKGEAGQKAFERIKESLEIDKLKSLVFSKNVKVRREAFYLVSDSFTADELQRYASSIINIPEIFSHPRLYRRARLESVKATIAKVYCEDFLQAFSKKIGPNEIQEIFIFLTTQKGKSGVIDYNLDIFLDLIADLNSTPTPILFSIAKRGNATAYSHRAMLSLLRRGKLNENMLRELKKAKSDLVRIYAHFHDKSSTAAQLAAELNAFIEKKHDVGNAMMLIMLQPEKREDMLAELKEINPRLAEELQQTKSFED